LIGSSIEADRKGNCMLIEEIATDVHSVVKELEDAGDTASPGYKELKQYACDLDLYESVRLTPEGRVYGISLIDRLLTISRYVDHNLHSMHASLMVRFLEERRNAMVPPAECALASHRAN
jgi:hypothetical protein